MIRKVPEVIICGHTPRDLSLFTIFQRICEGKGKIIAMNCSELFRPRSSRHTMRVQVHVDIVLMSRECIAQTIRWTYIALIADYSRELTEVVNFSGQVNWEIEILCAGCLFCILVNDEVKEKFCVQVSKAVVTEGKVVFNKCGKCFLGYQGDIQIFVFFKKG